MQNKHAMFRQHGLLSVWYINSCRVNKKWDKTFLSLSCEDWLIHISDNTRVAILPKENLFFLILFFYRSGYSCTNQISHNDLTDGFSGNGMCGIICSRASAHITHLELFSQPFNLSISFHSCFLFFFFHFCRSLSSFIACSCTSPAWFIHLSSFSAIVLMVLLQHPSLILFVSSSFPLFPPPCGWKKHCFPPHKDGSPEWKLPAEINNDIRQ